MFNFKAKSKMALNFRLLKISAIIFIFFNPITCFSKDKFDLDSPDGKISLQIIEKEGKVFLSQFYKGDTIIGLSPIGLIINEINFTENVKISNIKNSKFDETWETVIDKNKTVRNHYNEYVLSIKHKLSNKLSYELMFRCYNDGFAYRYIINNSSNDSIRLKSELTDLQFKNSYVYWAFNGERHNVGPEMRSNSKLGKVEIPMVLEISDTLYMAIHEAEIIKYAPFSLSTKGQGNGILFNIYETKDLNSLKTSWRTFIIGNRPGDLVESNLLINLNEPCKIEDTSWIKPGKSLWDWRVGGYKTVDGFEYGLNTITHKRFIDFAAKNNIQYLLIDADWYGPEFSENSDPTVAREGINIKECLEYANKNKIGIILYLNDVGAQKFGLEKVLKQFSEWGAIGVKYGFMRDTKEKKVQRTREVIRLCAKYKLMVDFHDNPIPPSGDHRTYPNVITREFGHAQADARKSYFPETAVTAPFINMIAGGLDYTNGWFDLNNAHTRERVWAEIPGTVSAEVAKLIVIYTGWVVLPDAPEEYLKKDNLFDCVRHMPAKFDSFKILDGKIGEFISVARKSGNEWFIGTLTNRDSRKLTVNFDFLPDNKYYIATLYEDTRNTHYLYNKETYNVREILVNKKSKIKIELAPGGGHSFWLVPMD
jgi:hypothetical protein